MLSEDTIWESLKDKIFDSTMTIVIISPGMKTPNVSDRNQWIPWEISYSLKKVSRTSGGREKTSYSNAMLAIVLPDKQGSYRYFIEDNTCCEKPCRTLKTNILFRILEKNMFNIVAPHFRQCNNSSRVFYGESSYIASVKWEDFISAPQIYIEQAYDRLSRIEQYNITKELNE